MLGWGIFQYHTSNSDVYVICGIIDLDILITTDIIRRLVSK